MPRATGRLRLGAAIAMSIAVSGCGSGEVTGGPPSGSASGGQSTAPSTGPTEVPAPTDAPSVAPDGPAAGTVRTDDHGIEQVWVPAGTFLMGTDETDPSGVLEAPTWARFELKAERPQHPVVLSKGYWIDRTEVTSTAYQAFIDDGGYSDQTLWSDDGWAWLQRQRVSLQQLCVALVDDHPRVCITWFEAEAYAAWRGGALPTEAQWEYAARGPESSICPWGDEWDPARANIVASTESMAVGSFPDGASWVGALDMSGNAMEWVSDWYSASYYQQEVRDDPTGPELGSKKAEKGGWWGSVPYVGRAAYRHFEDPPTYQDQHIGVRAVSAQ